MKKKWVGFVSGLSTSIRFWVHMARLRLCVFFFCFFFSFLEFDFLGAPACVVETDYKN